MLPIINILVGQQPMEGMHYYVCITTIDSNIIQVRVRFFINLELDYCIQSFGNGVKIQSLLFLLQQAIGLRKFLIRHNASLLAKEVSLPIH